MTRPTSIELSWPDVHELLQAYLLTRRPVLTEANGPSPATVREQRAARLETAMKRVAAVAYPDGGAA